MLFCLIPVTVFAGDLEAPAEPTEAGSAMYTLEAIYDRLDKGTPGSKRTGGFTEPSSGPGPTGHTLDDVMEKAPSVDDANGAGVADVLAGKTYWGLTTGAWGQQTGQRYGGCTCSGTLNGTRWCDNLNGTVTDLTTCLVWLKNASWGGQYALWEQYTSDMTARSRSATLENGIGGLSDGSCRGDWRLPTIYELRDLANETDAVRHGEMRAFTGVGEIYWTSYEDEYGGCGFVSLLDGVFGVNLCSDYNNTWPVRPRKAGICPPPQ